MIPLCVPHIRNQEWELIKQCVDSEWVSYAGSFVDEFEKGLAAYVGSKQATVTISGTSALHLALILSGVEIDDEVLLPALSFVAPANAIRYCKAWPTFIDVSLETWQWDLDLVEDFLRNGCYQDGATGPLRNRQTGRRVAAVMPVHLLGGMADLPRLVELCAEFKLPLIEDAAEAFGSKINGGGIGSPVAGDEGISRIVCTSFNGNKIMTTGGGGALFTNDAAQAARAKHLSTTAKTDVVEFDHDEVGYNYRLSNMAAALGVGQLRQMDHFVGKKKEIAERYDAAFSATPGILGSLPATAGVESNHWLHTVRLDRNSRSLLKYLSGHSIQSRPLWRLLSDLPFLTSCHVHSDQNGRELVETALSIPCSVGLTDNEQSQVIAAIQAFFAK
jgi:perosamine synthetase